MAAIVEPVSQKRLTHDHAVLLVPDDSNDLVHAANCLYITGAGNIKLTTVGGEVVTMAVPANFYLDLRVARVWATTTTATNIWALS